MVFLPWYGGKLSRQCSRKNPPPHLLTKNKQSLRSHLLKLKDLQQQKGSVQLNNRLTQKAVSGHCLFVPQRSDCKHRNYSFTHIQIQIWQLKDVKCASALVILCFLGCLCVWRIWKISATEAIVSRFLKQWLLHLNLNVFFKRTVLPVRLVSCPVWLLFIYFPSIKCFSYCPANRPCLVSSSYDWGWQGTEVKRLDSRDCKLIF